MSETTKHISNNLKATSEINEKPYNKNVETKRIIKKKSGNTKPFSTYIYKLLKTIAPDYGISKKSMDVFNAFLLDVFEKIVSEASRLAKYNKKKTISRLELHAAINIIIGGELAQHACRNGNTAVESYTSSFGSNKTAQKKNIQKRS